MSAVPAGPEEARPFEFIAIYTLCFFCVFSLTTVKCLREAGTFSPSPIFQRLKNIVEVETLEKELLGKKVKMLNFQKQKKFL